MNDDARRKAFVEYFETHLQGDRAKLIERTGYSKGRVAHFLDPRQRFGEQAAQNLAVKLGKPKDFFSRSVVIEVKAPEHAGIAAALDQLAPYLKRATAATRESASYLLKNWALDPDMPTAIKALEILLGSHADPASVSKRIPPITFDGNASSPPQDADGKKAARPKTTKHK